MGISSDDADSLAYTQTADLPHMHKAVLEVKGLTQLETVAAKLDGASVRHYLWREQPEDVVTALATWPRRKSTLQPHFKKLQLSSWYAKTKSECANYATRQKISSKASAALDSPCLVARRLLRTPFDSHLAGMSARSAAQGGGDLRHAVASRTMELWMHPQRLHSLLQDGSMSGESASTAGGWVWGAECRPGCTAVSLRSRSTWEAGS